MTQPRASDIEHLAQSAAGGDLDALGALFDRYADPVTRYILVRTHHHAAALDLASITWEKVAKKIRQYGHRPGSGGFPAWLFTIARNTIAEYHRGAARRPERLLGEMLAHDQPDSSDTPAEQLDRKLDAHKIAAEINRLPVDQRRCLLLRFFTGLSISETADAMGRTPGAVKQLQLRGLNVLRQRLPKSLLETTPASIDALVTIEDPAIVEG